MKTELMDFVKPTTLECLESSADKMYGKYSVDPLERGFGVTIGNSLRRYLLSSIPGVAIVAVKVSGIHHEFSTLPNVYEDVSDIILNLKQIVVEQDSNESQTLVIDVKGKMEITGANITCPAGVRIVNSTSHIASLMDKKATFQAELYTRMGRGYCIAEEIEVDDTDVSIIPIDATFSPIRRVNFNVLKTRVGHSTDYDKLVMEVWTNGTIDPETAISNAARIQRDHMQLFSTSGNEPEVQEREVKPERKKHSINLNRSVEELELSVRSYNCLQKADIKTIAELVTKSDSEMLKTRNFGRKSLNEIKAILEEMGLKLGMSSDELSQMDQD